MRFTKMHGAGNDYVYLDGFRDTLPADLPALARQVSPRHTGVGSDGLIIIEPDSKHDARMRMWNADGSESEMCGNGLRCAARLAWDHGHLTARDAVFATGAGPLAVTLRGAGDAMQISVAMGAPRLTPDAVPVRHPGPGPELGLTVNLAEHGEWALRAVGMGNPHAVALVADAEAVALATVGPLIEQHPDFPNRTNVEMVSRRPDRDGLTVLRQRTWERGSGITMACGTGACASAVAAMQAGVIPVGETLIDLDGGTLHIAWDGMPDHHVHMTGSAVTVFEGDWPA